jgi:hypothetical protein
MIVERNTFEYSNADKGIVGDIVEFTPRITPKYWRYRVRLSEKQAILGFDKMSTIGIGFEHEIDWNINLPFDCNVDKIFNYVNRNNGDKSISNKDCKEAIKLIQDAVFEDLKNDNITINYICSKCKRVHASRDDFWQEHKTSATVKSE